MYHILLKNQILINEKNTLFHDFALFCESFVLFRKKYLHVKQKQSRRAFVDSFL